MTPPCFQAKMGAVFNAIAGPLLIYFLLLAHVGYRVFLEESEPLSVQDFPKGTTKEAKDEVIKARREIIKDVMDAFAGRPR